MNTTTTRGTVCDLYALCSEGKRYREKKRQAYLELLKKPDDLVTQVEYDLVCGDFEAHKKCCQL